MTSCAPAMPAPPSPRRLLAAAQALAAGFTPAMAAAGAELALEELEAALDTPAFQRLAADCRQLQAEPRAVQDARLERLVRAMTEQALLRGHVSAIPCAMRLLGLISPRPPAGPASRRPGEAAAPADRGSGPPAADAGPGRLWGMVQDEDEAWVTPTGRDVMPGREVAVVETPSGPVRLLDIDPERLGVEGCTLLAGLGEAATEAYNRAAYPWGGLQWDPKTRTVWHWEGIERDLDPAGEATPEPWQEPSPRPSSDHAPSPVRRMGEGGGEGKASSQSEPLARRLDLLLAGAAILTPDERDLAEAVCALCWPNWPAYAGRVDLAALKVLLNVRPPLQPRLLTRFGGACRETPGAQARGPP